MGQLYEGVGELEKAVASYRRYHVFFYLIFCHALEGAVVLKMAINFLGFRVNHYHRHYYHHHYHHHYYHHHYHHHYYHHYHHHNNNNVNDNTNNNSNDNDDDENNN